MFLPQGSTRSQCCALSSSLDNVRKETDASFLTTWALVGKLRREACMLMAMKRKKVSALLWGFHKTNPSKAGLRAFIVSIKTSSHLLPPAHLYPLIVSDLSRDLSETVFLVLIRTETMDDWDEEKLEEVVNEKHGEKNKSMPKTTIVSNAPLL